MLIDSHSTVRELLGEYPDAFGVLAGHGMCADCEADPPPVPLERFANKHCGGDLSGLVEEIEAATRTVRVEKSNRAMIEAYRLFADRMPDGRVDDLDGVTAAFCNVELSFLNMCILNRPVIDADDLKRRLERAADYGTASGFPWFFALCEDWLPKGWEDVCTTTGYQTALRLTGMAANGLLTPRRAPVPMEFRRVRDRTGGCEVGRINCAANTMPGELGSCLGAEKLWQQGTFGHLGFVDDEPVCTSTVLPIAETLYVVLVATLPDYEKRGFGEAVMRHSLEQASEETGIQRTALHASDAGYPLYKAMGYRDIAKFTLVLRQE